jgi:hypothetical protein
MNVRALYNDNDAQPVIQLSVDRIVMEGHFPVPLEENRQKVYDALMQLKKGRHCAGSAAAITKKAGYENSDHVADLLWELVRNGYISAYRKDARWVFCDHETALGMIKNHSRLHWKYAALDKRLREDGSDNYERPM